MYKADMKAILFLTLCGFAVGSLMENRLRMVGSDVATSGEFPYLVSIQLDGSHRCGGSLITKKHILTAAHCVTQFFEERIPHSRIKVVVGTNRVTRGIVHEISRVAHHPSYERSILKADVAVIRLRNEVTLSAHVRIIGLPKSGQTLYEGLRLDVSGFGADYLYGPPSAVLKKLIMYTVSPMLCMQFWQNYALDDLFCAAVAPGYGVCQGDSGGPVTINKQIVVGIVSGTSGSGCGLGAPDLFTFVPKYLDFIQSEIKNKD